MFLRILFMVLTFSSVNAFCQKSKTVTIPFYNTYGGIIMVDVMVNDNPLRMIVDYGASYISINNSTFETLKRQGTIGSTDIKYKTKTLLADGTLKEAQAINLKKVSLGDFVLTDVEALVISEDNAPLLIGQNVLTRFSTVSFDNINNSMSISHPLISELKLIPCDEKALSGVKTLYSLMSSSATLKCEYVYSETRIPTNTNVLNKLKHKLTIRYFMDVDANNANAIKRALLQNGFDDIIIEDMTPFYDEPMPCYFEIWINSSL